MCVIRLINQDKNLHIQKRVHFLKWDSPALILGGLTAVAEGHGQRMAEGHGRRPPQGLCRALFLSGTADALGTLSAGVATLADANGRGNGDVADGVICGLGARGYEYALQAALNILNNTDN